MENTKIELEAEVIAHLHSGRKVAAIKAVRTLRGIGLKDAKRLVELYAEQNQITTSNPTSSKSASGFFILILFSVGCYFLLK